MQRLLQVILKKLICVAHFIMYVLLFLLPQIISAFCEPMFTVLGRRRRQNQKKSLIHSKRLLVIRLDFIGDIVLTTPFLRELRRNFFDAWITLVVMPEIYTLVKTCPYVNEVINANLTYDFWWLGVNIIPIFKLAWRHLWKRQFDLALPLGSGADYYHAALIAYLSGAERRLGYSGKFEIENLPINKRLDNLLTHPICNDVPKHELRRSLDLIWFLGGNIQSDETELWVEKKDDSFAERILAHQNVDPTKFVVVFGLGAREQKRMWPITSFAKLGHWLKEEFQASIILVGGVGEKELGHELEHRFGIQIVNLIGRTTLRQAAAMLKLSSLFIGNDSAPAHIATAMGIPTVVISCHPWSGSSTHLNSPFRYKPWSNRSVVIQPETACPPCTDSCSADRPHCICGVTPDEVKEWVFKLVDMRFRSHMDDAFTMSNQNHGGKI